MAKKTSKTSRNKSQRRKVSNLDYNKNVLNAHSNDDLIKNNYISNTYCDDTVYIVKTVKKNKAGEIISEETKSFSLNKKVDYESPLTGTLALSYAYDIFRNGVYSFPPEVLQDKSK